MECIIGPKFLKSAVKKILSPILPSLKAYFVEVMRKDFESAFNSEAKSIEARFQKLESAELELLENQRKVNALLSFQSTDFSNRLNEVYVSSNGSSYLEQVLTGETNTLDELKIKYGEDSWYYLFEKLFRGSEEEIARRQSFYLKYIYACYEKIKTADKDSFFLDFGFGRGEMLSLLHKDNVPALGVDTSLLNFERANAKDLRAIHGNGLSYLEKLENNSLYGVVSFQVIEHLPYDVLKKLVELSYQKTKAGGLIILETVNPSCDLSMRSFYMDPTHLRPFPPELVKFLCEWVGFKKIEIVYYMPASSYKPPEDTTNYVGYALIGYK